MQHTVTSYKAARAAPARAFRSGSSRCERLWTRATSEGGAPAELKVLVAGSTGGTGQAIVKELVARDIPVTALVRDPARGKELLPSDAKIVQVDVLQEADLKSAVKDVTAVICALGPKNFLNPLEPYRTDFIGAGNLIRAAEAAKVRKFVLVSTLGTDNTNPLILSAFWGVLYFKKRGEETLQSSTMDYTIVRPGNLRNEGEAGLEAGNTTLGRRGTFSFGYRILRSEVARCCVEALTANEASNKIIEIVSSRDAPALSYPELFKRIG